MKCPGQDRRYWVGEPVFDMPCPKCGTMVELFQDEGSGRCRKCGHRFLNPKTAVSCAQWCPQAKECVGFAPGKAVPQQNLKVAQERAFVLAAGQSEERLQWLGAEFRDDAWRLPVLNEAFCVDLRACRITTPDGVAVGLPWGILALHYLAITKSPELRGPEVTFADLGTARSYAGVYHQRVIGRLCAVVGGDVAKLRTAAETLGGRGVDAGDLAFDFAVFPRFSVRLVWNLPDDEFPPSATLLLPANAESYFCSEDLVVLSERLVSRLAGRLF
jgi:hypothetical protein